ncbi:golgin-like protein [Euroglyphus maynei]|uniref:Golgin-like protein n=1 Tax=Euroglyphus maynei TaxID=6958 RepID=A0A1Y3AXS3_EURMA|nr:golgin-like protein [Euroglyphus maynei]
METLTKTVDDGDVNVDDNCGQIQILQEQCNTLMNELIELRSRYDQIETMLDKDENETIPRQIAQIKTLQDQLEEEMKIKSNLQNDIDQLSRDCKSYQDDLNQIKSSLSARIAERDEEIDKLRRQLILKQQRTINHQRLVQMDDGNDVQSSSISDEWEQRLKSLTENLITKQSMIEQLSSTNHSLKLQLERSEQKLRELITNNDGQLNNDVAIGIYHSPTFTNMIKHRMTGTNNDDSIQSLIHDNPNDGQVTRKVKRAYTAIDKFSIRLGNFLRLYPSARAAFLIYIIILHVWVAFVLMYYEPEIHGSDFNAK